MTLVDEYRSKIANEYNAADATLVPHIREAHLSNAARWASTLRRLEEIIARRRRLA